MREYKIGTMLRKRYDQYFGPDYWPAKIYARSTEVPRTQLSLQLVLAGLFPPSEKQTWNPHLPWIPTWTFFVPYKTDTLLFPQYCYRWVTLQGIGRKDLITELTILTSSFSFLSSIFFYTDVWYIFISLVILYSTILLLYCKIKRIRKKRFNYLYVFFCAWAYVLYKKLIIY